MILNQTINKDLQLDNYGLGLMGRVMPHKSYAYLKRCKEAGFEFTLLQV